MAASQETGRRGRGRPPRSQQERAQQRERLIDAVMDGIRVSGAEASIDDLAAAAGVSKPTLYAEVGDKLGIADAIAVVLAARTERQVLARLTAEPTLDIGIAITAIVDALVALIETEPELYRFLVRSLRTNDRGLLDNALVRVIHQRAELLIGQGPEVYLLADGIFGFVLAAAESWKADPRLDRDQLVDTLSRVIRAGLAEATATG